MKPRAEKPLARRPLAGALSCLTLVGALSMPAAAGPASPYVTPPRVAEAAAGALAIPVAQGCGPGAWRGPWGGCRDTPYTGPLPGGGYAGPPGAPVYYGNGCPPGFWRGPWGHCRDTPYHGPLPGGGWKP